MRLVREPIDVVPLCAATPADGAVCVFVGVVRSENAGRPVLRLEYEAYEEMALPLMEDIAAEARRLHPITGIRIVHRLGTLEVGEPAVVVAVTLAAPPRGLRRQPLRDRRAQVARADLEEGALRGTARRGWRGRERASPRPELSDTSCESRQAGRSE